MANDKVSIDLSNYKDKVGARVTPDDYLVVVEDAEMDTARSGNKMINVWFRILEGEFQDATITDRLVLTEKSLFRVVGFMQALGMPTPKKRLQVNLSQFIGKTLVINVDDGEPYNGRIKSEVRGYMRATKKTPEVSDPIQDELAGVDTGSDEPAEDVDLDKVDLG